MSFVRDWGSTPDERAGTYPCDALVDEPHDVLFRAIDVAAPPAVTFRWLCQLRVAPYSYDWIDNLGRTSPRTLTPGLEQLARGQRFMTIFTLASFERDRHLTLVLDRARGAFGDLAITYAVVAAPRGSRIIAKLVVRRPRGLIRLVSWLLPAGDWVMMQKQLRTLRRLTERSVTPLAA